MRFAIQRPGVEISGRICAVELRLAFLSGGVGACTAVRLCGCLQPVELCGSCG